MIRLKEMWIGFDTPKQSGRAPLSSKDGSRNSSFFKSNEKVKAPINFGNSIAGKLAHEAYT